MFLYFDSSLGGLLLEPLLRYQAWPNVNPQYTARDAGKLFFGGCSHCTSSQIFHKERRTRIPQSRTKPMTKVSSVRQINLSCETSSYSEDDSSRDCEYAVNDLCPRSYEWRHYTHPNPRWCFPRLNWRFMRTFTVLSYEKLDRIPCRLNTLHRAAVRIHQSKYIAYSLNTLFSGRPRIS